MQTNKIINSNKILTIGFISVNNFVDFPIGGGLYFLRNILKYWDITKDNVILFGCGPKFMKKGWHIIKIENHNFPFFKVYTNENKSIIPGRLKAFLGFFMKRNFINNSKINLLYVHEPGLVLTLFKSDKIIVQQMLGRTNPLLFSRFSLFRKKFFVDLYDFFIHQRSLKKSTSIIALNEECNQFYNDTTGNITQGIIPTCADTQKFTPKLFGSNSSDELVILFCGRLNKVKGIDFLLQGFYELLKSHKNSKLIIVGDGQEKNNLILLSKNFRINDKVSFLGFVDYDSLPKIHKMAHVFVMTSFREGLSVSMLEAMSSGLAVLSTDTDGAKEIIDNEFNGILFSNKDRNPVLLSKSILKAYNNRHSLGKRARETIENKYSAEIVAELVQNRLHEIYKKNSNI